MQKGRHYTVNTGTEKYIAIRLLANLISRQIHRCRYKTVDPKTSNRALSSLMKQGE